MTAVWNYRCNRFLFASLIWPLKVLKSSIWNVLLRLYLKTTVRISTLKYFFISEFRILQSQLTLVLIPLRILYLAWLKLLLRLLFIFNESESRLWSLCKFCRHFTKRAFFTLIIFKSWVMWFLSRCLRELWRNNSIVGNLEILLQCISLDCPIWLLILVFLLREKYSTECWVIFSTASLGNFRSTCDSNFTREYWTSKWILWVWLYQCLFT